MTNRKGTISVKTNDIFPIIKKWLYSEHDIFVRELTSNASDAITKRQTLARTQNLDAPVGAIYVHVNKTAKTIQFVDNGLGMTETEIEKYIAQLAFSGAEEFVEKMKAQGVTQTKDEIIGRFGLGFYSAFMAAETVEVESLSMTPGSLPAKWVCKGDTDYEFLPSTKSEIGTTITLHVGEDAKDFLDAWKLRSTLRQYCDFMPHEIVLVDDEEVARITAENLTATKDEDKKPLPHDVINETTPLWKKSPKDITDEEYKEFYRKLFPMDSEPLFWLHLNVDHPFTLQGILFFPKINASKPIQEQGIKLYCKQVFVSDSVKNIIPDFLSLLKGAIDSTDIPLNVSRSSLQGDPNIKKISAYIVKKVAESLKKLFNTDRARFESVWEDIGLLVKYGCVSDDKFDELARSIVLFKNSEQKYVTLPEYQESIPEIYKEKLKTKVIYFDKTNSDEALRKQLWEEKISTIETDQYIDPHFMQHAEFKKLENLEVKFVSISSEIENLLQTEDVTLDDAKIKELFSHTLIGEKKDQLDVEVKSFKNSKSAAYFKVDEQMRRFQQMTKQMGQTSFNMPLKKTLVVNPSNVLIQNAFKLSEQTTKKALAEKICHYVQDLAILSSEGLNGEEKEAFVVRSQELMQELSGLAL